MKNTPKTWWRRVYAVVLDLIVVDYPIWVQVIALTICLVLGAIFYFVRSTRGTPAVLMCAQMLLTQSA